MDLKRFHMKLNVHKVKDPLVGPIIIHEMLPDSKLVQGWARFPGTKMCWHVWVEDSKKGRLDPSFIDGLEYFQTLPNDEPFDSDPEMVERLKIYNQSPKNYWNLQPKGIRNKLLTSLKREQFLDQPCGTTGK